MQESKATEKGFQKNLDKRIDKLTDHLILLTDRLLLDLKDERYQDKEKQSLLKRVYRMDVRNAFRQAIVDSLFDISNFINRIIPDNKFGL